MCFLVKPIFVVPAIKKDGKVSFFLTAEEISAGPEDIDEVLKIFKLSDGSNDLEQIAKTTKIPINKITEIVSELGKIGIIVDSESKSRSIIRDTYDFVNNRDKMVDIMSEIVGRDKPVKRVCLNLDFKNPSFYSAIAVFCDAYGNAQFAGATSTSSLEALFKATVEGYERWRSSQVRVDIHSSSFNLRSPKIEPYQIIPMTYFQAEKSGVKFYDEKLPIDWTLGNKHDGSKVYVPSDIVYYGHRDGKNRIYYGNSSGVAAFTDLEEAKKRALTELIERDALMCNWFSRKSPNIISHKSLPDVIKTRISKWKERGRTLYVLEIPSEYGKVFEAIFVSDQYPCFVSGAAATLDGGKICETVKKAVDEAEFNLDFAIRYPQQTPKMKQIVFPVEHGRFYYDKKNAKKLNWLWSGSVVKSISRIEEISLEELYEKLQAVSVDLSDESSSIKVVRIISPELVPINFGYYTSHFLHSKVGDFNPKSIKYPHYFS